MPFYLIFKIIAVIIAVASVLFGLAALRRPDSVIRFQQRFCERINWMVEPISWDLEIRSTKRFGRILLLAGIGILILVFFGRIDV